MIYGSPCLPVSKALFSKVFRNAVGAPSSRGGWWPITRSASLFVLVVFNFVVTLVGCGSGEAANVAMDCEFVMLRTKDGILEMDRRVRRDKQSPVSLAKDLRERLRGYESQLANCDATNAQTIAEILRELDQIVAEKPSGNQWRSARERLLQKAEALPVEATPAEAFDD